MFRAALYGVPGYGAEWQKCYSALLFALEQRFGDKRVWQRTTKYFEPADVATDVAVAVIQGLRGEGHQYLTRCLELNIPTLVVDLGWMRRERGFWQVSLGGLNSPPLTCPGPDRFENLDLKVFPIVEKDYHSIVIGQVPGDMQHDLKTDREMLAWATKAALEIKTHGPRRRVYWRPHPAFIATLGKVAIMTHPTRSIQEFIRDEKVGSAVVYNSTLGLDLLRNGIHVVAQGPRTVYTDLVSSDIANLHTTHPGPERVRSLLERLAYGQYQVSELTSWTTLERLFALHDITGDW